MGYCSKYARMSDLLRPHNRNKFFSLNKLSLHLMYVTQHNSSNSQKILGNQVVKIRNQNLWKYETKFCDGTEARERARNWTTCHLVDMKNCGLPRDKDIDIKSNKFHRPFPSIADGPRTIWHQDNLAPGQFGTAHVDGQFGTRTI